MNKKLKLKDAEKTVAMLIHIATVSFNAGKYEEAANNFLNVAKFLHNWKRIVIPEIKKEKHGKPEIVSDMPKRRDPTNDSPFNSEDPS